MTALTGGRPRVLFISTGFASFCQNDVAILEDRYDVRRIEYRVSGMGGVVDIFLQMLREMDRCDFVYSWFGDIHSSMASVMGRLLSKKVCIVAGGYDVANEPEIGYGLFRNPLLSLIPRIAFGLSHGIIAVSMRSKKELLSQMPGLDDRIEVIYNGVDTESFHAGEKRPIAINVGAITEQTLDKKGIRHFIQASSGMDGVRFIHAGRCDEALLSREGLDKYEDVDYLGFVDDGSLRRLFSESKVCVQTSFHESFGMTVVEGMASGCIPIVTMKGALPEVAGDCGRYVEYGHVEGIRSAIRKAMASDEDGTACRDRAVRLFDIGIRRARVLDYLQELFR